MLVAVVYAVAILGRGLTVVGGPQRAQVEELINAHVGQLSNVPGRLTRSHSFSTALQRHMAARRERGPDGNVGVTDALVLDIDVDKTR